MLRETLPKTWQGRLGSFLRSVIPADPAQLLFLAGVVCLVFAPRMSWWPRHRGTPVTPLGPLDNGESRSSTAGLSVLGMWAIIFSALTGYYVCFWPGARPVRRLFSFVLTPAVMGICLIFGRFAYLGGSYSILDNNFLGYAFRSGQVRAWVAAPGFHVALLGLLLVGIFAVRLIRGVSLLPLALPEASVTGLSDSDLWRRGRVLIWVLAGPLFLAFTIPAVEIADLAFALSKNGAGVFQHPYFSYSISILSPIVSLAVLLAIVSWIIGENGRGILRRSMRFSKPEYLLLGAAFSVGIAVPISLGQYVLERAHWAGNQFLSTAPPQLGTYFKVPSPWLFLMFFAAFGEEAVFRGLLQSVFVLRYGLYRGIFMTGIVWAASHFSSDAGAHLDEAGVLYKVGFRVAMCLALGFVLSWLTLRSASILPASVAHTLYNVLVSGFGPQFPGKGIAWVGLWAVLALVLFRYWPVQSTDQIEQQMPMAGPGIAT